MAATKNDICRVLVTGGAGYIGSHVVYDLLDLGYEVIVLDNLSTGNTLNISPRSTFIQGDIRDDQVLDKIFSDGIDVVFHFAGFKAAGRSMTEPNQYSQNNISGTLNILNTMNEYRVKYFIFSSSAAVYGNPVRLPITETHPLQPINYYGYTKLAVEQNLQWFSQLTGLKYAALRYFNATGYDVHGRVKGKEENPNNLCPIIMDVASGVRDGMEVYGDDYDTPDGTCIRDYIHVNDLSTAHIKSLDFLRENQKNLVVNLGIGTGYSVKELLDVAEKVVGKRVKYTITGRRLGDPAILIADATLAKKSMNWNAVYSDPAQIFRSMLPVYCNRVQREMLNTVRSRVTTESRDAV